jgi:nicotinate-nucleotide adenylyltransferase
MAETAIRVAQLDVVYFVTSVNPPHKSQRTHANILDRHAMVALALCQNVRLIPSSLEFDRPGKSYSIDTVLRFSELAGPSGRVYFLIGLDAFLDLATWKDYQRFPELCSFLVFTRPGYNPSELASRLPESFKLDTIGPDQIEPDRFPSEHRVFLLDFHSSISSTGIRQRVREGLSLEDCVPKEVENYISKTRLYLS